MYDPELIYKIKIHKVLSQRRIADLLQQFEESIIKVKNEKIFQKIEIEGIIDAGFAVVESKELLNKWTLKKQHK